MPHHTIIVGAGVTGLSTAYHLAKKNHGKITIIEKGNVGDGSSSRAAGIITGLMWSETGIKARKISLKRFRELSDELDSYHFENVGWLNLFDADSWPERETLLPIYDRLNVEYSILDSDTMHSSWPQLSIPDGTIGLFDPLGGYSEPDHYIPALEAGCRALGVEILENCIVSDVIEDSGCIVGVVADNKPMKATAVVSTVHVWTLKVLDKIGLPIPLKSFIHQRYVTETLPSPVNVPAVNANPWGGYFRPAYGNRLLVGIENPSGSEYVVPNKNFRMSTISPPQGLSDTAKTQLLPLVPNMIDSNWDIEKAGLLSFSLDGEPILGPVEQFPGLYVGVAFHSGGFAYNPAAGFLLAECIAIKKPSIDIKAFSPDRFNAVETETYLKTRITQSEIFTPGQSRRH